jgi:hypothetical protein
MEIVGMPQGVPAVATETKSIAAEHPLLWHYTDLHAFKSIVAGNAIWGTFFDDLNDSVEFRHMREPLAKGMGERLIPLIEKFEQSGVRERDTVRIAGGVSRGAAAAAQRLMQTLNTVTFRQAAKDRLQSCFVASFCSHQDDYVQANGLLSQWRSYAADGGFCLVFDTKRLEELIEEERAIYQYWSIGLNEAHYFEDGKDLPSSFVELAGLSEAVVALAMSGANFSTDELFVPFVVSAATIKHSGFEEEREVRLVAMAMSQIGDEKMKSVPGYASKALKNIFPCDINAKISHHIRLFGDERSKLPIVKVIVGPARDQRRNAEIARQTVGKDVDVVCSATPLIV